MSAPTTPRLSWFRIAAATLIAGFAIAYTAVGWHNFTSFSTGHDLAGYTQALHRLNEGSLPYNSFKEQIMWGDHAHFVLVLLTPVFSFWPDARALLIIQALAATTAGWALFRVASDTLRHPLVALALLYAYLSFVGLQYALNFDFHSLVLTSACLAWLMYAYHFKKWPLYWTTLAIGLATREDAPLIFFMIGVWQLLTRRFRLGAATAIISGTYFLIVIYAIMPQWTPGQTVLPYLNSNEKDPASIISSIVTNPITILQNITDTATKRHTLHTLVQSHAYLPALSPFTFLASAPAIYSRFNTPDDYRWLLTNHSNANIVSLLAFGALFGLLNLQRLARRVIPVRWRQNSLTQHAAAGGICAALLLAVHVTAWRDPAVPLRQLWDNLAAAPASKTTAAFQHLRNQIPPDASVTASSGFTAHLARYRELKYFSADPATTDWVIVSPHANPWPFNRDQARRAIAELNRNSGYQLVAEEAGVWLFQRTRP